MTHQEIFVTTIGKNNIQNTGAGSLTNHLQLYLEITLEIKSCHIDSVCFVPDGDNFIVTLVVSDVVKKSS